MNPSETLPTIQTEPTTSTQTQLHGRWLWAARAAWVVVVLLVIVMFGLGIPLRVADLRVPCIPEECLNLHVSTVGAQALEEALGITPLAYALMGVGLESYITLVFFLSGMVIAWRKSDDWMALFTSALLVLASVGLFGFLDTLALQRPLFSLPVRLVQSLADPLFILLFYLFPDGRVTPGWVRWPAFIITGSTALIAFNYGLFSAPGLIFLAFVLAGGVLSQIYRYRNISSPTQRQQTKWVIFGFGAMFLAFAISGLTFGLLNVDTSRIFVNTVSDFILVVPFALLFAFLPMSLVPITFAISTLRAGLWNVDPILNRSLVYGGLTIFLGLVFAGGFLGLRTVMDLIFGSEQVVIAAALAGGIIVGLFNPAHRRLRSLVDRRLYHIHVDYQKGKAPTPSPVASSGILRTQVGAYQGLEPIGRGGMAEIYKAQHPALNKTVAIKVLPPALAKEADFRHRFEREARVVGALKHPNIVQVFDFGEAEGTYYMVLEYVEGQDLGAVIRRDAPLSLDRVRAILGDVASALDYAHGQGLVHRDVKPSNVMLEPITAARQHKTERAVLMDFGIARILGGNTYLTATGTVGTFDYIAPEQIQAASHVDGRADIYALGVMTYQMLTGRLPFQAGHPAALLIAHLHQPAPDPCRLAPHLPEATAQAILRAMAKSPQTRFATAGAFAAALG